MGGLHLKVTLGQALLVSNTVAVGLVDQEYNSEDYSKPLHSLLLQNVSKSKFKCYQIQICPPMSIFIHLHSSSNSELLHIIATWPIVWSPLVQPSDCTHSQPKHSETNFRASRGQQLTVEHKACHAPDWSETARNIRIIRISFQTHWVLITNKLRRCPQQAQHVIFTNLSEARCEAKKTKGRKTNFSGTFSATFSGTLGPAPKPPRPSPEPSEPSQPCWNMLKLTWLCTKASQTFTGTFSGTLLNLTWLCTKPSQTFSGTFSGTLLNLTRCLHQCTPELFWAEDPISFRCWGKSTLVQTYSSTWLHILNMDKHQGSDKGEELCKGFW